MIIDNTYEKLQYLKKEIEQKHATSEHTKEADVVVLTHSEEIYRRIHDSLEGTLKAWKSYPKFRHATNASDAFWTRKGVSVFITDYFLRHDFSIFGPDPIGGYVARLYREDENAIVALASPYFDDYSIQPPDYNTKRYLQYWRREYRPHGDWWPFGVGFPEDVSQTLSYVGYRSFGVDEKGMNDLKLYINSEIDKRVVTIKTR